MAKSYLQNVWYMAGWQEEAEGVPLMTRKLLNRNWLIYKLEDGTYAMLEDRCPHRFAPLSKGKRIGDTIACGYHGLRFNSGGQCIHNPFSDLIPPKATTASLPIIARYGILWFWPGDPLLADTDKIPEFAILDNPQPMVRNALRIEANYELLTDNLMDLSHIEFVHEKTFQSGGALLGGRHHAHQDDGGAIWSCWSVEGVPPPRFAPQLTGQATDRWTNMRWNAPATMSLEVGCAPHGVDRAMSPVQPLRNPHIVTPESETSSWYFYNFFPGEDSVAFARKVFEDEDRPMLEAVEDAMGEQDFWDMRPVILNVDGGAVRARRHLQRLRNQEGGITADFVPEPQFSE